MSENIMWDRILEVLGSKKRVPNTFTLYLGKQLKSAREEVGLSQNDLANKVYRRRPSISDMENGKMMPDIGTVVLLAVALDKSVLYFIAPQYLRGTDNNSNLGDVEKEVLLNFRRLNNDEQQIAIKQLRVLTE